MMRTYKVNVGKMLRIVPRTKKLLDECLKLNTQMQKAAEKYKQTREKSQGNTDIWEQRV